MSESMMHPTPDRLEAYAEGTLEGADRAVLESHLRSCGRCQAEAEEWRALFSLLSGLPRLAPSPGFAARVMAGVRVRHPWYARVADFLGRFVPKTTTGWALVTAVGMLPILAVGAGFAWLLAHPGLTAGELWAFVSARGGEVAGGLASAAGSALLDRAIALVVEAARLAETAGGIGQFGAIAALVATLSTVSAWVLYRNLFRTPTREATYAS